MIVFDDAPLASTLPILAVGVTTLLARTAWRALASSFSAASLIRCASTCGNGSHMLWSVPVKSRTRRWDP